MNALKLGVTAGGYPKLGLPTFETAIIEPYRLREIGPESLDGYLPGASVQ